MNLIKKIVVITAYPFNQRDYDRFGIELLRNNGYYVEIWDISSYFYKKIKDQLIVEDSKKFKNIRIFKEKYEIVNAILSLDKGCIINCFIEYSLRTFFIFRMISKCKINYCVFGFVCFPHPCPIQNSYVGRIVSMLKKIEALKCKDVLQHIFDKILLKYYYLFGISPAFIIILGGEKSQGCTSYPVNKTTTRLWTHMPDYDIYLQYKTELNDSCKIKGVFLDEYLPFHPDFYRLEIYSPISPTDYYPTICTFFDILEKNMNTEIVIAVHPRSNYNNLPDYFGGRSCIKGKTGQLIKDSSFVIAHMSTSIGFAVLYHKPIVFITTDKLYKMNSGKNLTGSYIQAIAAELGKNPINIDHMSEFNWNHEMEINEEAYLCYKNNYIKKKGTPEKPLWEIFCSYIQ